jgi:hypothetical protein
MSRQEDVFSGLRLRPEMYVRRASFDCVVAFMDGYDYACDGGPLCGFTEWLVMRTNAPPNWVWSAIVLEVACPGVGGGAALSDEQSARATETLFQLLESYTAERAQPDGLGRIFAAFAKWKEAHLA